MERSCILLERQEELKLYPVRVAVRPVDDLLLIELDEARLGRLGEERAVVRDVGPRILRHVVAV